MFKPSNVLNFCNHAGKPHIEIENEANKKYKEIFNALIDYTLDQVYAKMVVTGEPFEVAFNEYLKGLSNEQVEGSKIR